MESYPLLESVMDVESSSLDESVESLGLLIFTDESNICDVVRLINQYHKRTGLRKLTVRTYCDLPSSRKIGILSRMIHLFEEEDNTFPEERYFRHVYEKMIFEEELSRANRVCLF